MGTAKKTPRPQENVVWPQENGLWARGFMTPEGAFTEAAFNFPDSATAVREGADFLNITRRIDEPNVIESREGSEDMCAAFDNEARSAQIIKEYAPAPQENEEAEEAQEDGPAFEEDEQTIRDFVLSAGVEYISITSYGGGKVHQAERPQDGREVALAAECRTKAKSAFMPTSKAVNCGKCLELENRRAASYDRYRDAVARMEERREAGHEYVLPETILADEVVPAPQEEPVAEEAATAPEPEEAQEAAGEPETEQEEAPEPQAEEAAPAPQEAEEEPQETEDAPEPEAAAEEDAPEEPEEDEEEAQPAKAAKPRRMAKPRRTIVAAKAVPGVPEGHVVIRISQTIAQALLDNPERHGVASFPQYYEGAVVKAAGKGSTRYMTVTRADGQTLYEVIADLFAKDGDGLPVRPRRLRRAVSMLETDLGIA